MDTKMIRLTGINKIYRTKEIETQALENVNIEVEKGEFLSVMGPSGCGKSTLLNIIGMLDTPTSGRVELNGVDVTSIRKDSEQAAFRNRTLGFIFQSFHLVNTLNVLDNVQMPLFFRRMPESERVRMAKEVCMYMSGVGTRKNMKMAVAYFIEASMKNNLFAMLNLAELYFYGYGVDRNVEKARELYTKAFEMGYTDAMVLCGDTYMEGGVGILPDHEKAISCYQQALLKHSPFAVYRLGWVYNMDLEEIKDKDRALSYYDKAVSQKYPDALADYGIFYREGEMFPRDYQKSLEYLLRAADRGSARAMYELYTMYMCGYGVEQNYKLAKTWLTKYMANKNKPIWGYSTLKSEINSILGK